MASYSTLTDDDARSIAIRFGLDLVAVAALPGGMTNSSFLAQTTDGTFTITVLDDHDMASATALADLMDLLGATGLATPRPRRTPAGDAIVQWEHKPVMVEPFVAGTIEHPLAAGHLPDVGAFLAGIHLVMPPPTVPIAGRSVPLDWDQQLTGSYRDSVAAVVRAAVQDRAGWPDLPTGLIHGDLFDDNVLIDEGGGVVVLDWETAAVEPFVLDLGMAAVGLCRISNRLVPSRLDALLGGYESVRPLSDAERECIRPAVRYAAALLTFNRYLRHRVLRPDDAKQDLYLEMLDFGRSLG